jgi:hypothetical protein
MALSLHEFATSGLTGSRFRAIVRSRFRGFESSGVQSTAHSRLQDFVSSRLQIFVSSLPLKTCITNFINLDVSRVTGFSEFPNTGPSGKRVDSDDPIPRTFQNFSKKRHPRNVGGDTRHPETSQRSNRGMFAELPPLAPINRWLPLLNFFHHSLALLRTAAFSFAEIRLAF